MKQLNTMQYAEVDLWLFALYHSWHFVADQSITIETDAMDEYDVLDTPASPGVLPMYLLWTYIVLLVGVV